MYEYKFIRLKAMQFTLSGHQVDESEYQSLIRKHAQQGWRFVQIFASKLTSQGRAKYYNIIFEREVPGDAE